MRGIECACFGAIGSDNIELRTSKNDKPWTSFNLAVDVGEEKSQWLRVSCFGEVAERVATTFKKNDRCYIEGAIRLDHWTDKLGVEKHGLSVSAFKVEKVGASAIGRSKPSNRENRNRQAADAVFSGGPAHTRLAPPVQGGDDFNDAMPF